MEEEAIILRVSSSLSPLCAQTGSRLDKGSFLSLVRRSHRYTCKYTHTGENEAAVMDEVPFIISSNYPHRHRSSNNKKQERGSSNASLLQQKRNQGRAFALLQLHIFRDKVEMSHLPHFMLQPHVVEL